MACAAAPPPVAPSQSTGGLVEKLSLHDLAARAGLIVVGKVVGITYAKDAAGNIYTQVAFSVEQTLKGESAREVVINVPGGKLDGRVLEVEDAPSFQSGEKAVVFLQKADGNFRVVGGFQGKFSIGQNDMVGGVPLQQFIEQVRGA